MDTRWSGSSKPSRHEQADSVPPPSGSPRMITATWASHDSAARGHPRSRHQHRRERPQPRPRSPLTFPGGERDSLAPPPTRGSRRSGDRSNHGSRRSRDRRLRLLSQEASAIHSRRLPPEGAAAAATAQTRALKQARPAPRSQGRSRAGPASRGADGSSARAAAKARDRAESGHQRRTRGCPSAARARRRLRCA